MTRRFVKISHTIDRSKAVVLMSFDFLNGFESLHSRTVYFIDCYVVFVSFALSNIAITSLGKN